MLSPRFSRDEEVESHFLSDLALSATNLTNNDFFYSNNFPNNNNTYTNANSNTDLFPSSNRTRSNTNYTNISSPVTDGDRDDRDHPRSSVTSPPIPISPLVNYYHHHQPHRHCLPNEKERVLETAAIIQLQAELQFKTLDMLALIKGTTREEAYLNEKLEEIRSQRSRSTDYEEGSVAASGSAFGCSSFYSSLDDEEEVDVSSGCSENGEFPVLSSCEYLVGSSFVDVEGMDFQNSSYQDSLNDPEADDDIEEDIFGMEV